MLGLRQKIHWIKTGGSEEYQWILLQCILLCWIPPPLRCKSKRTAQFPGLPYNKSCLSIFYFECFWLLSPLLPRVVPCPSSLLNTWTIPMRDTAISHGHSVSSHPQYEWLSNLQALTPRLCYWPPWTVMNNGRYSTKWMCRRNNFRLRSGNFSSLSFLRGWENPHNSFRRHMGGSPVVQVEVTTYLCWI